MKKLFLRILMAVALIFLWGAAALASGIDMPEPPDMFDALVINIFDMGVTPLEYDFMLIDGEETMCFYAYDVATSSGGKVRVERDYMLTYCKTTCLSGEPVFITGSYSETNTGSVDGFMTGHVEGQLLMMDASAPDPSLVGRTFIALTHFPETVDGVQASEQLLYTVVFLEPIGWFPVPEQSSSLFTTPTQTPKIMPTATPRLPTPTPNAVGGLFASPTPSDDHHTDNPYAIYEEDHHHSSGGGSSRSARKVSSSNLPETSGAAQVAIGAILVSVAAALSYIPSTTLGSGMSSFTHVEGTGSSSQSSAAKSSAQSSVTNALEGVENASQGLESASGVAPPSGAHTSSAVEMASGAAQSAGSSLAGESAHSASAFVDIMKKAAKAVWDFTKMLLANLRDMITDEGRSYASGRISNLFEEDS